MVFLALSLLALTGTQAWPEEMRPKGDQVAMSLVPGNPLMQLPGMNPGSSRVTYTEPKMPAPIITDVSNAPNPFDSRKAGLEGKTRILYRLENDVPVRVTLYDLLGFRVRRWDFSAGQNGGRAGQNDFLWDGTNESGQKVSKGGYLAQIEIETSETVVTVIRKIGLIH